MNSGTIQHLNGLWGTGGADVFAAGTNSTIVHFDGSGWAVCPVPAAPDHLYGIWGTSSSDVFVVGERETVLHHP
jgi:hypothetical protein